MGGGGGGIYSNRIKPPFIHFYFQELAKELEIIKQICNNQGYV